MHSGSILVWSATASIRVTDANRVAGDRCGDVVEEDRGDRAVALLQGDGHPSPQVSPQVSQRVSQAVGCSILIGGPIRWRPHTDTHSGSQHLISEHVRPRVTESTESRLMCTRVGPERLRVDSTPVRVTESGCRTGTMSGVCRRIRVVHGTARRHVPQRAFRTRAVAAHTGTWTHLRTTTHRSWNWRSWPDLPPDVGSRSSPGATGSGGSGTVRCRSTTRQSKLTM